MGKGRKNRKPQAAPPAASSVPTAITPRGSLVRRVSWQFAALLVLSIALGYVFNSANPIGVRFDNTTPAADLHMGPATNFLSSSTNLSAAEKLPPAPPLALSPSPTTPVTHTSTIVPVPSPQAIPSTAPAVTAAVTNPAPIHWRDAKPLAARGQAVLMDVRPRPTYDAGHIPNAVSMPETSPLPEFVAFMKLLPTNTTLIVYCASTSCSQSKRVAERLVAEFHYSPVKYMTGGYQEYQQEELAKSQPPNDK